MFTLKLYKRVGDERRKQHLVISVYHVEVIEIAPHTLEIRACSNEAGHYESFYVGERTPEMTAVNDNNHWGWGLLENWEGNTSEHYRPASYG